MYQIDRTTSLYTAKHKSADDFRHVDGRSVLPVKGRITVMVVCEHLIVKPNKTTQI